MEFYSASKMELTTDKCNNVDKSQKFYVKWKKPDSKG